MIRLSCHSRFENEQQRYGETTTTTTTIGEYTRIGVVCAVDRARAATMHSARVRLSSVLWYSVVVVVVVVRTQL